MGEMYAIKYLALENYTIKQWEINPNPEGGGLQLQ